MIRVYIDIIGQKSMAHRASSITSCRRSLTSFAVFAKFCRSVWSLLSLESFRSFWSTFASESCDSILESSASPASPRVKQRNLFGENMAQGQGRSNVWEPCIGTMRLTFGLYPATHRSVGVWSWLAKLIKVNLQVNYQLLVLHHWQLKQKSKHTFPSSTKLLQWQTQPEATAPVASL